MSDESFIYQPPAAFRGQREYVHSTDIYEDIIACVAAAGGAFEGPIDLRIRSKIVNHPRYTLVKAGDVSGDAAVTCTYMSGGVQQVVKVSETDTPVAVHKPYDEGPASRLSTIEGRTARLDGSTWLRPIEALTALAVHLHKSALPPPVGQRWMLGQLSISRPLAETEAERLTLEIDRVVSTTMTRTKIFAADGLLGTMLFILSAT